MTADGPDHRDAGGLDALAEILRGAQAIGEVVLVEDLLQADGQRLQVAPGKPAVGGEALGDDHEAAHRLGEARVADGEKAADVSERILLRAHQRAVAEGEHLAGDFAHVAVLVTPSRAS